MRRFALIAFVLCLAGFVDRGQAQDFELRSGAFPDVDVMEQTLVRGVSSKADVVALIGRPNGRGGAMSNLQPDRPREIWVYEELDASMIEAKGGVMRMHIAQQFLMVYFVDGRFDGFWWHDTSAPVSGAVLLGDTPVRTDPAGLPETPIETLADFEEHVVGRPLTNAARTVRLVVRPDGQMAGIRKDGQELTGPWHFENGMFCRAPRIGEVQHGWDCQFVTVSDEAAIFYRDRGEGVRMIYYFQ